MKHYIKFSVFLFSFFDLKENQGKIIFFLIIKPFLDYERKCKIVDFKSHNIKTKRSKRIFLNIYLKKRKCSEIFA